MGLWMFVLSKVGQIGVPPNPQTKTMVYFMPVFMTILFLRFASGLNIYYAVSNIFSIPQQYLIARRRLREQGKRASESCGKRETRARRSHRCAGDATRPLGPPHDPAVRPRRVRLRRAPAAALSPPPSA